jgi:diacylglycerol kinase family enzyme
MRVVVMLNRRSGTAPAEPDLRAALERVGIGADVVTVPSVMGGGSVDAVAEPYDLLVAAGGDGTVSTVAAAAARLGKVFGVIPSGTLNHFARDTGIPLNLDEAAAVLAAGHTRALDIGVVNDHVFINNASVGVYPRLVWERTRARAKGLPRPIAMSWAVARTWFDLRSVTARLTVDGREIVRRTPFIFIGNSAYEVTGTDIGKRMTMTDGKLSLYMAPRFGRGQALLIPLHVLFGTLERHERFEAMQASTITLDTPRKRVGIALDGELRMLESPLQFSVHHGALMTVVPRGA